ncbi:MAG: LysE family translocator [Sneathiella sp.]|nr:LysE family translocator [Sneathiella sp.]
MGDGIWIEYLVTSLIVVIAPGTGVLYTVGVGLARGSTASIVAAFGCTLGIVPHMTAAILGLAALLHASATAFQIFKMVGVVYLLWMAWNILKEKGALEVSGEGQKSQYHKIATTGFLINILNPKLSIFFLAFLPQFVPATAVSPMTEMAGLSAVFMALTFIVFIGYGLFAAALRQHVITKPRVMTWLRRSFAAAFVGLAARLTFAND